MTDPGLPGADIDDWSDQAACRTGDPVDPTWWFAHDHHAQQRALEVCIGCPVATLCLTYALEHGIDDGIWGGLTVDQRHTLTDRMRRRYRRPA